MPSVAREQAKGTNSYSSLIRGRGGVGWGVGVSINIFNSLNGAGHRGHIFQQSLCRQETEAMTSLVCERVNPTFMDFEPGL